METRVNYTAVGAFVIFLTTALVAGILLLSTGLTRTEYRTYVAYVTESVSGLNSSAPVKYKGVDVGHVSRISLAPGNPQLVRIEMAIAVGTPVKVDTVAVLSVQGLTGIAFIDLTGGTSDSPLLEARSGEPYPVIQTGPSLLARLDAAASQMFTNIQSVSESISSLIDEESGVALRETLQNVRNFTARLDAVLDDENAMMLDESIAGLHAMATVFENNAAALDNILTQLSAASDQVPGAIEALQRTAGSLERMGNSLSDAGDQLSATMVDTQMEVRNVSQQLTPEAMAVLSELRSVSASLERFVAELERDPSVLIYGRRGTVLGPGEGN